MPGYDAKHALVLLFSWLSSRLTKWTESFWLNSFPSKILSGHHGPGADQRSHGRLDVPQDLQVIVNLGPLHQSKDAGVNLLGGDLGIVHLDRKSVV